MDLGIEVILELFTTRRLQEVFARSQVQGGGVSSNAHRIYALREEYVATIEPVIAFLHGKQPTLARQIASENFLPQASRFEQLSELDYAFGNMGHQDKAKHLATLYLEDISDFIVECVDPDFGFSRYAEKIGRSANSFTALYDKLQAPLSFIDELTVELLSRKIRPTEDPGGEPTSSVYPLVCFSVPFPGNLFSAFRCAQWLKAHHPEVKTAMGGGFANTELRSVSDTRVFDFFDFITLDDGELPLELLLQHLHAPAAAPHLMLKRTFLREGEKVVYNNLSLIHI